MTDHDRILATLDEYAAAYCAKDIDRLMALFVPGEGISLIGTGADELCSGRREVAGVFARNFRDATALRFDRGWTDVAIHGDAATVALALTIQLSADGREFSVPVRWTVTLTRTDEGWKWVHRHASAAAASQDAGSAYPAGR